MKIRLTVSIDLEEPVPVERVLDHVHEAIESWGGQYHPDDLLFPTNFRGLRVEARRIYTATGSYHPDEQEGGR